LNREAMWSLTLPLLESQMKESSFDVSSDWADAVRFAVAKRAASEVSPLTSVILSHVKADLGDTVRADFASQAKWLRLLQSILAEWGSDPQKEPAFCDLADSIIPQMLQVYSHSYEVTRVMIAKTMFLLFDFPHFAQCSRLLHLRKTTLAFISSTLSPLHSQDAAVATLAIKHAQETTAHWLLTCALGGESAVHQWHHASLVPSLFDGLLDEDATHQKFTRSILKYLAQSLDIFPDAVSVNILVTHDSWKVREEAIKFIGVLDTRLNSNSSILITHLPSLLGDSRLEVCMAARDVASLVFLVDIDSEHCRCFIETLMGTSTKFLKPLKRKTKKNQAVPDDGDVEVKETQDVRTIRFCVHGLSGLVLSSPFEVPLPVVPAISMLVRLASGGGSEAMTTTRETFMDFKRTHLDNWEQHRMAFDEHTLEGFNETFEAPSYFC